MCARESASSAHLEEERYCMSLQTGVQEGTVPKHQQEWVYWIPRGLSTQLQIVEINNQFKNLNIFGYQDAE